ncbi:hypothetical protein V8C42DRAFT_309306 [Trichoderma barbatum]
MSIPATVYMYSIERPASRRDAEDVHTLSRYLSASSITNFASCCCYRYFLLLPLIIATIITLLHQLNLGPGRWIDTSSTSHTMLQRQVLRWHLPPEHESHFMPEVASSRKISPQFLACPCLTLPTSLRPYSRLSNSQKLSGSPWHLLFPGHIQMPSIVALHYRHRPRQPKLSLTARCRIHQPASLVLFQPISFLIFSFSESAPNVDGPPALKRSAAASATGPKSRQS